MAASGDWDVLLIGGGGAVGKTHLASRLARRFSAGLLQADDVRLVLQRAVPTGVEPSLHFFLNADIAGIELDDALARQDEIARYVSHKLEAVVAHHVATRNRLIIEGDGILPELAALDIHAGLRTSGRVRAVFIEEADQDAVYRALHERDRGDALEAAERLWAHFHHGQGWRLAQEARRRGIPVVAARPRRSLPARVLQALSQVDRPAD